MALNKEVKAEWAGVQEQLEIKIKELEKTI